MKISYEKSIKNQDALTGNRTRAKSLATIYCTIQLSTLYFYSKFCVFLMKNQRDALTGNRTRAKSLATIYCTIQLSTLENIIFFLRSGTCRDRTCDLSVNSRTRCRCAKEPHCICICLFVIYVI